MISFRYFVNIILRTNLRGSFMQPAELQPLLAQAPQAINNPPRHLGARNFFEMNEYERITFLAYSALRELSNFIKNSLVFTINPVLKFALEARLHNARILTHEAFPGSTELRFSDSWRQFKTLNLAHRIASEIIRVNRRINLHESDLARGYTRHEAAFLMPAMRSSLDKIMTLNMPRDYKRLICQFLLQLPATQEPLTALGIYSVFNRLGPDVSNIDIIELTHRLRNTSEAEGGLDRLNRDFQKIFVNHQVLDQHNLELITDMTFTPPWNRSMIFPAFELGITNIEAPTSADYHELYQRLRLITINPAYENLAHDVDMMDHVEDLLRAEAFAFIAHRQAHPILPINYEEIHEPLAIAAPAAGINVHANDRDARTKAALESFYATQGDIPQAAQDAAYNELLASIEEREEPLKTRVKHALFIQDTGHPEFFPCLIQGQFSVNGLEIHGKELISRLWIYASTLEDVGDRDNAKLSIIQALHDSFNHDGSRVCNQGKTQRLVAGVLQGRLPGVNIEGHELGQVTKQQAVQMFFHIPAHAALLERDDDARVELLAAANAFADVNPNIPRAEFLAEVAATADATW
jgi:hypothetical protein